MVKSLTCVAKSSINPNDMGDLFNTVYGFGSSVVAGIAANATTGTYGAYGMCNSLEQLSFAFNAYYQQQSAKGNSQDACDFGGAATTQTPAKSSGNCNSLIDQAGTAGTGTVTSAPTGTGGSGGAATSSGVAHPMTAAPSANFGLFQLGAYVVSAVLTGAGMIFL
jgi:hypothetical protein